MKVEKNRTKLTRIVFALFGTSILVVFILYLFQNKSIDSSHNPIELNRRFVSDSLQLTSIIKTDDGIFLREIKHQKIYLVRNWSELQILDTSGLVLLRTGKQGRGPDEYQQIWDVSLDSSGIFLADGINHTITVLSLDGKSKRYHTIPTGFSDIIKLNAISKYLLYTGSFTEGTQNFTIYDYERDSSADFSIPRLIPSQSNNPMVREAEISGQFCNNHNGTIFYICNRSGQFTAFDNKGKHLYSQFTIDKTPLPEFKTKPIGESGSVLVRGENNRFVNISADANSDYLYILSNAQSPFIKETKSSNHIGIIDIYHIVDGSYVASIKLPEYILEGTDLWNINIKIYEKFLYVACADLGRIYRFLLPSSIQ